MSPMSQHCNSHAAACTRAHPRQERRADFTLRIASDDLHQLHLHRHSFELTRVGGKPTAGVMKDVVMMGGFHLIAWTCVHVYLGDMKKLIGQPAG